MKEQNKLKRKVHYKLKRNLATLIHSGSVLDQMLIIASVPVGFVAVFADVGALPNALLFLYGVVFILRVYIWIVARQIKKELKK